MTMHSFTKQFCCLLFVISPAQLMAQQAENCAALTEFSLDGFDVEVTNAQWFEDRTTSSQFGTAVTLPPHCHVEGAIDRRFGVNNVEYSIRFAINMPRDWNGRFLFQGGGGLNGVLGEPLGTTAAGTTPALMRGFAVVSNDSGHQASGPFDSSFFADQEASLNFYYRAIPRVTEITKPLVAQYYGRTIEYSYFTGCSTGGREGMLMAQRYPLYYDGVISGAPAMRTSLSNIGIRWVGVQLNQAAPLDDNGRPQPGPMLSEAERKLVVDALMTRCDGLDGAVDNLLFNPRACDFDPRVIACDSGDSSASCLSPAKAEAIYRAMQGPRDSRGIQVYPGFEYDPGIDDVGGLPGILASSNNPPEGAGSSGAMDMDVDAEVIAASRQHLVMGETLSVLMSSFAYNGGKQIFFHGAADPWFSVNETIRYYEEMAEFNGGLDSVKDWSRFFYVPGMAHCAGGEQSLDSFDLLTGLVDWVENGTAPNAVTATGRSMPGISRPLCAWPTHPQYNGSGNIDDAASYSCQEP
jgi:hypothetical protein